MTTKISTANIQTTSLELLEGGGGGTTAYDTLTELPLSGVDVGEMAFVAENNRLYLWTGAGWFNIALINTNPSITSGPSASYALAKDGTPTVITLVASDPEGLPITWSYQVTSGALGDTAVITQDGNEFTITPSTNSSDIGTFQITFTASDGVNLATAASNFTLLFSAADARYNQSVVLTTSDTNNANNNTFIDSSTNSFAITRSGNTTQGSFSPYSPAEWSAYIDGSGDYLTLGSGSIVNFGTGDFTIEMWVFFTNSDGLNVLDARPDNSNGPYAALGASTSSLDWYVNSAQLIVGTSFPQLNQWAHIAVSRSSGVTKMFLNGVQTGSSYSDSTNYESTSAPRVGANAFIGAQTASLFISNYRVTKGTALYTANFTPPTEPLTAVANTSLLTLQDNRFIDRSTNNFTITKNGDTRIVPFSPFLPTVEYTPNICGGSAYFDGTGDTLSIPTNAAFELGSGDFTIEAWVYLHALPTTDNWGLWQNWMVIGGLGSASVADGYQFRIGQTVLAFGTNSDSTAVSATHSLSKNAWYHLACVRNGNIYTLYKDGVSIGSATYTANNPGTGAYFWIGSETGEGAYLNGYVSDLRLVKGTALYTANFTPPTEPLTAVANTSLLLNFTNAGVYDETGKVVLETVGDTKVSTSVVKYGNTSMYFDGTGDHVTSSPDTIYAFGTGDFTVECWVYITADASATRGIWQNGTADNCNIQRNTSGNLQAWDGADRTSSTPVSSNAWNHIAFSRASGTARIFVNGVVATSWSSSVNYTSTAGWVVGYTAGGTNRMTGYIQDFRITKGHARYTANFTPPTTKLGFSNDE